MEWQLSDNEWIKLAPLLRPKELARPLGGRPRNNDRALAEACLFRMFHSNSEHYRCFGWNQLPKNLGVAPATANRRYREWNENGSWSQFWQGLLRLRHPRRAEPNPAGWSVTRRRGRFPVGDIVAEIERAYAFFNAQFFGGTLPDAIALSVEQKQARRCHGYYCARAWRDATRELGHIAIHAATIVRGANHVCAVLLHEMTHLRNDMIGIEDCHRNSQYHNRHFRDMAALAGLSCKERSKYYGYAFTELNAEGRAAIRSLQLNKRVFRWSVR